MEEEKPINIDYRTIKSEEYVCFSTNRVWGGFLNGRLFEMNFLLETNDVPEKMRIQVHPDGSEKELSRSSPNEIKRIHQASAHMSIETMISLHEWLSNKINQLEEEGIIRERKNKEETDD